MLKPGHRDWGKEKMHLCTSHVRIVWDSGYMAYYLLKPHSHLFSGSGGLFLARTCPQVFDTSLVNPLFLLIFDTAILSSLSQHDFL